MLSIISAKIGQPWLLHDDSALADLAVIFSILSAFAIAALPIVGNPQLISTPDNRTELLVSRELIRKRLLAYSSRIILYLYCLVTIVVARLVPSTHLLAPIFEELALASSTFGIGYSISMPFTLFKIQLELLDQNFDELYTELNKPPFPSSRDLSD